MAASNNIKATPNAKECSIWASMAPTYTQLDPNFTGAYDGSGGGKRLDKLITYRDIFKGSRYNAPADAFGTENSKCSHVKAKGRCDERGPTCYIHQTKPLKDPLKLEKMELKIKNKDVVLQYKHFVVLPQSWPEDDEKDRVYLKQDGTEWLVCVQHLSKSVKDPSMEENHLAGNASGSSTSE